jgi:type III pantothenate kinase
MINFCIDIGNTLIKLAIFEDKKLVQLYHYQDINRNQLEQLLLQYSPSKILLTSTRNQSFNQNFLKVLPLNHRFFEIDSSFPLEIKYKNAQTLGKDRILAALAATKEFEGNILLITSGTCITYNFISDERIFMGGAVSPGIQMRYNAMHNFTGNLPLIKFNKNIDRKLMGTDTQENLISGVINGVLFEIEGFIEKYRIYDNLTIVCSGGDSEYLVKLLKNNIFARPHLVLYGLNEVIQHD